MAGFLDAFRVDVEELREDPFTRAMRLQASAERFEAKGQVARLAESRERGEDALAEQETLARMQIATRGYSDAELAQWEAQRKAADEEELAQAWAVIERLDPARRAARRQEQAQAAERQRLERARRPEGESLMRARAADFDRKQGELRRTAAQVEIAYHQGEIARMGGC